MGIRELRKLASELGIKGYSKLNKAALAEAVAKAQSSLPNFSNESINLAEGMEAVVEQLKERTPEEVAVYLGILSKGEARKVRKALRGEGLTNYAAIRVSRKVA